MSKWHLSNFPRFLRIVLILVSLTALSWPALLSKLASNVGLLLLARSMTASDSLEHSRVDVIGQVQAQQWLQVATAVNHDNQGAWRGLGFALAGQGQEKAAITAWRTAQATTTEFIWRGDIERAAQHFAKALEWYQRAVAIQPELSDGWYYTGLAFQGLGEWTSAQHAYERAIRIGVFDQISRSSLYYRLGVIYQQYLQPPLLNKALNAYSTAFELNDFMLESEAADCHYKRGAIYETQGLDRMLAQHEYEIAVLLNPKHEWAHLRLGVIRYRIDKNLLSAKQEIERALQLWPADTSRKWPYRYLGDLYSDAGMTVQAVAAYREALGWDPRDPQIKASLSKLEQHD